MNEQLIEAMVNPENALRAFKALKRNKGAPGIDGMTVKELADHLRMHWSRIKEVLLAGDYRPAPVKRVEIPKPDGGKRPLGIPTMMDRFVQQLMLGVLTPIFDPMFSASSHGFRPGRSAHDAVKAAQQHAREGATWVVDIDISQFFDRVHHDILMHRIGQTIRDKRMLRLIGRYLRAGVFSNGLVIATDEGTPQGGPLSPLLANIYLDALDKELERRGHRFSRYADDCNIYVGSEAAAKRVLRSITAWIETNLKLTVNAAKSGTGQVWERKFLGFQLTEKLDIGIAPKSVNRYKAKVREMWRSCQSQSSEQLRDHWRAWVRGWCAYFKLAEDRRAVTDWEGWTRRHIRCCFWQRWHGRKGRYRRLRQLGLTERQCEVASSSKGAWVIAACPSMQAALSNRRLSQHGFLMPSEAFA
jgi:group II intron reverse transcriptase/maturase